METNLQRRKALFWDIPEKDIERVLVESDDWVIMRVFEYGTLNDIFDVINLYGEQKIRAVLSASKMPPVTRAMAYLFFDLDQYDAA